MPIRSLGPPLKVALAGAALTATMLAAYVQIFERRSRQEEDGLAAARLEQALEESRARLRAEVLAQLRAELANGEAAGPPGDQPLPNVVLRRGESGSGRALQQVPDSRESEEAALARLQESLEGLERRLERSDRALRRDLEAVRVELRRERDLSGKTLGLLLIALVPLVILLLASLRPAGARPQGPGAEPEAATAKGEERGARR